MLYCFGMNDDEFSNWGIDALRGYVIMRTEFLSGSMYEDPLRELYSKKLEIARKRLQLMEEQVSDIDHRYRYARSHPATTGSSTVSR